MSVPVCTVGPSPFDVYWTDQHTGPEAANRNAFRGEIQERGRSITENSEFAGAHGVRAWLVKDGVAVPTATQDVITMSR